VPLQPASTKVVNAPAMDRIGSNSKVTVRNEELAEVPDGEVD
jgi:hypothetical protein